MLNAVDPDRTSICYIDGGANVVSQNGDFFYSFDLKTGDVVYGSVKKGSDKFETYYLHDYNPREEIVPTDQFEVSIIDKGNDIIDSLSNDPGMYTPGTKLEFYSYPIMDVDLAMYVNDEFYQIQDTIKINDEYMWKYTFVMPAENVVIEFKTFGIEYTTVRNVLNIPDLSINDIDEVRYEHGYIGVAPGHLTNISYSTDMEDKNMLLSLLDMPVYEDVTNNWQICGGGYSLYSIFTNSNERYDVEITNDYISINKKHYRFIGEYISFEFPSMEAHSFITYLDTFEAYTLDSTKIGDFVGLSDYEFIEYPYDVIPENENAGYIETEFGRLYIHSDNIFYIKENNLHTYYLIVGDKNFSNIFNN